MAGKGETRLVTMRRGVHLTITKDLGGRLIGLPYCLCGHLHMSHTIGDPEACCMDGCNCKSYQFDEALGLVHEAMMRLASGEEVSTVPASEAMQVKRKTRPGRRAPHGS